MFLLCLGLVGGGAASVPRSRDEQAFCLVDHGLFVRNYFTGFFKQVHRPPQHLETLGLAICFKILQGVPFLEQTENIFILHAMEKITTPTALFRPDGVEQRGDRLGQFLPFLWRHLHMNDDQYHIENMSKRHADRRNRRNYLKKASVDKG